MTRLVHSMMLIFVFSTLLIVTTSDAVFAQTMQPCWSCARKVTLMTAPFMTAKCCKPGATPGSGAENCDPLAQDGWGISNVGTIRCEIREDDSGHQYCQGFNSCSEPEPDPCENCFWYVEDGVPEGEEEPCGPGSPAFNSECQCCEGYSPIIINLTGNVKFSDKQNGVLFDLTGTGNSRMLEWPEPGDDGWLALDRNGNGKIDNGQELFGNFTPLAAGGRARNGFIALKDFDANDDGIIDGRDPGFAALRVWRDTTRDGQSTPTELLTLASLGISALTVDYKRSMQTDRFGNTFRYRAEVHFESGNNRFAYDVFLGARGSRPKSCPAVNSEIKVAPIHTLSIAAR